MLSVQLEFHNRTTDCNVLKRNAFYLRLARVRALTPVICQVSVNTTLDSLAIVPICFSLFISGFSNHISFTHRTIISVYEMSGTVVIIVVIH